MSSDGLYGSKTSTNMPRVLLAEFVGTWTLVVAGTAVAVWAILNVAIAGAPADSQSVALTFGFVLTVLIIALGHISGCHLNPAVTIALAVVGKFPPKYVIPYIVVQISAAITGSLTVFGMIGQQAKADASLAATKAAPGIGAWNVFFAEMLAAFILMFVIMAVATDKRVPAAAAGLAGGLALFAGIMIIGPVTGGGINPARALGPMIVSGHMDYWYMYVLGPIAGMILAAITYQVLRGASEPSDDER